jgi:hypothetical protein
MAAQNHGKTLFFRQGRHGGINRERTRRRDSLKTRRFVMVINHVVTLASGRHRGADFQTLRKTCWARSSASAGPIILATVPITRR